MMLVPLDKLRIHGVTVGVRRVTNIETEHLCLDKAKAISHNCMLYLDIVVVFMI